MLTLSLYDVAVTPYLQTLDAFSGVLAKGLAYFQDSGLDPDSFVDARFAPDMRPFGFQVHNVAFHSKGSVEAVLAGTLTFSRGDPNTTYAELQAQISEARSALRQVDADVLNACAGQEVVFAVPNIPTRVFTAEGFVLSFSLPNLHFHATTAYDLLRQAGAPLGKRDYMGELRLKA
jgi:hypothetical protein